MADEDFYATLGVKRDAGGDEPMFSPPPIPEALEMYLAMLEGSGLVWAVALLGGSVVESPLGSIALSRGGHLRVGLEDEPTAASNVATISRARELAEAAGRPVATPTETAKLLGLPS